MTIRTPVADISVQGRFASGVKMMSPDPGDRVMAVEAVSDLSPELGGAEPGDAAPSEPDPPSPDAAEVAVEARNEANRLGRAP